MLSSLDITGDGVVVRNFPCRARIVPLSAVDRFDEAGRIRAWYEVREVRAMLLLTDGSRVRIRSLRDPESGGGVAMLNNQLASLRRA